MTEHAYDPEFPFVAVGKSTRMPYARFNSRGDAERFYPLDCDVIDTTPKPKIPEDAQFIAYRSPIGGDAVLYARRYGHSGNKVWQTSNPISCVDEQELVRLIGDAEVTVLVPKENG